MCRLGAHCDDNVIRRVLSNGRAVLDGEAVGIDK